MAIVLQNVFILSSKTQLYDSTKKIKGKSQPVTFRSINVSFLIIAEIFFLHIFFYFKWVAYVNTSQPCGSSFFSSFIIDSWTVHLAVRFRFCIIFFCLQKESCLQLPLTSVTWLLSLLNWWFIFILHTPAVIYFKLFKTVNWMRENDSFNKCAQKSRLVKRTEVKGT